MLSGIENNLKKVLTGVPILSILPVINYKNSHNLLEQNIMNSGGELDYFQGTDAAT